MTNAKVMKFDTQKIEITRFGRQNTEIPKNGMPNVEMSSFFSRMLMLSIKT